MAKWNMEKKEIQQNVKISFPFSLEKMRFLKNYMHKYIFVILFFLKKNIALFQPYFWTWQSLLLVHF